MSKKSGAVADPLGKVIAQHDQAVRGTEIVLVVDESGSMMHRKPATISAINEFLDTQKQSPNPAWVTMTFFDTTKIRTPISGEDLAKVSNLTDKDYNPSGGTPLYDAIGKTVREIEKRREKVKSEDRPAVLFIIVTDGEENSSQEFTKDGITSLIAEKEKDGWTFVYIGAQRDAWADGMKIGTHQANTFGYQAATPAADLAAYAGAFKTLSTSSMGYRIAVSMTKGASSNLATESFFTDPTKLGSNDDDANTVKVKTETTSTLPKP